MISGLPGFSLTMWYVNNEIRSSTVNIDKFFINYVVCKSIYDTSYQLMGTGFSLTMWYVNIAPLIAKLLIETVFH